MNYHEFYQGFINLSVLLNTEFDHDYVVQDVWLASFNALSKQFVDCKLLMCYYHAIFNCRKEYGKSNKDLAVQCKKFLRKMYYSIDLKDMERNFREFKKFSKENCQDFYFYVKNQWLTGPFKRLQTFNRPEELACTNSPICRLLRRKEFLF